MSAPTVTPGGADDEGALESLHRAALDATFTGFCTREYPTVERFLRSLEPDRGMVEDVTQEAFIAARSRWEEVQHYEKPVAWVIRVARYKLMSHQRARRRRPVMYLDEVAERELTAPTDAREAEELLEGWLRRLPQQWAEVMRLSLDGWKDREIAAIVSLAYNTVRSYKAKARAELQRFAQEAGFSMPTGRRRR